MSDETTPVLYCANHPDRETLLRCNRCNKPICYECAVLTPVGYRCKECVREQQSTYFNAARYDLPVSAAIALVLGMVLGILAYVGLNVLGWFSFIGAIFVGPAAGGVIAEAVRRGVGRRRARHLNVLAAAACAVGVLAAGLLWFWVPAVLAGVPLGVVLVGGLPMLFARLDVLLLAVLAASTIYARLR